MSKIRINELARELEVKPHKIIDLLPDLGVSEKKTHSSSIDEDVALKVRHLLRHEGGEHSGSDDELGFAATATVADEETYAETHTFEEAPPSRPSPVVVETSVETAPPATPPSAELEKPVAGSAASAPRPAIPLRPPLAGVIATPPAVKETPVPPPPAPAPAAPPPAPAPPPRTIAIPAKPAPVAPPTPPRPGQIISGPRQPLPPPAPQRPPVSSPGTPAPGSVIPGRPRPPAPPPQQSAPASPGRPIVPPPSPPRPQVGKPAVLAGQPAARPVVPPRPDLVARLQQTQTAKPAPGQPMARGPMPGRPASPPAPGQPVYRGPIRPGQPILRPGSQPGAPGGRGPQRPGGRPMHPTTPLRPEVATPVPTTEQQRRDAGKKQRERHREIEVIEKDLRLQRRNEPEQIIAANREITISEGMTVKEFSEKLGIKANLVIKKLVDRKIFATINQTLDVKLAEALASDFGATTTQMTFEEESTFDLEMAEDAADMQLRPPVVTIMGHVDHGKTSLLDSIRKSNVVAGEFGGITQHIGAYYVEYKNRKIVFIDTPGHEAFTRMRARGAKVTDIVILVVAADDGVMPQTKEAIDHARAAKVPIIVAVNKIDKPEAQPDRIKQQLTENGLMPEEWGGDTVTVPLSAKTGQNLDLLLEMILLVTDMQSFKANPNRPAVGTVLEAELDRGRGPVATVLVRKGTLRVGDYFVCGSVFSRVRAMFDDRGAALKEAGPSMPVEVLGLDEVPEVGDTFQVVTDTAKAKQIVLYREAKEREEQMKKGARVTLETLAKSLKEGEVKELNIILKADVGGTCEVLSDALQKLSTEKVRVRVLHTGVGAITETDVLLASASEGIIVGFNVRPDKNASSIAEQEKVDIRLHTIIYELTDEIKKAMAGLLEPVIKETFKGRADVRDTFRITKVGTIAGCYVTDGSITRDSQVRLLRDNIVIFTGKIGSLKRFKDDASEVKTGYECGIGIHNYNDVKPGDVIEAFITEKLAAVI
ncbi:MAG: translation initiation factor IF-2 [Bryobacterales bacterium]|nr:translation initiation factor IF-2 [Bryobacterales bacterium]